MKLNLTPLLQTILENDAALEKGLETLGETIFNIHASMNIKNSLPQCLQAFLKSSIVFKNSLQQWG